MTILISYGSQMVCKYTGGCKQQEFPSPLVLTPILDQMCSTNQIISEFHQPEVMVLIRSRTNAQMDICIKMRT